MKFLYKEEIEGDDRTIFLLLYPSAESWRLSRNDGAFKQQNKRSQFSSTVAAAAAITDGKYVFICII